MTGQPGVDHPEKYSDAEVMVTGRGISVSTRVESVEDDVLSVRPAVGDYVEQTVAAVGDRVEVFWMWGTETRALPAQLLSTEGGPTPRWRLQITGPAEISQRRQAVRGRVSLPVEIGYGTVVLAGETVDLSETGTRAWVEGVGVPPQGGSSLDLVLQLDDGPLRVKAEVVRAQIRTKRWLVSIHFRDVPEKDGDRIRRRVFQALREERARLAD